ncbi:MAG: hypothetical protein OXJ55_07230 [Caldilineaceae bacterium]|nr:hypothetical protein [Caldilineaceae bacterium]MDE0462905.1 hypothetical protein [Caldilineaceae bacterium]
MGEITALWQEAEQHLREFERLARRTVEEAWLAGDALMRIKEQLPHGAWTPALQERGIAPASARRFIQLRKQYPQIAQIERFGSVSAALTDKKAGKSGGDSPVKTAPVTAYLVSADDLWDWERGEVTALARRLLSEEELQEFSANVTGEIRFLAESFKSGELLSAALYMMRRLSCHVNIGPLKDDPSAVAETKSRLAVFSESAGELMGGTKALHGV